jgi:hypothetical protein
MMVCVANNSEESALEMKVPMSKTHTIWPTEAGVAANDVSGFDSSRASSSRRGSLQGDDGPASGTSLDASLEERLRLLDVEVFPDRDKRGVRSVLTEVFCAAMVFGHEKRRDMVQRAAETL